jgi:hypothetical protein
MEEFLRNEKKGNQRKPTVKIRTSARRLDWMLSRGGLAEPGEREKGKGNRGIFWADPDAHTGGREN